MKAASKSPQALDAQLKEVFAHFPQITLAVLFGSVALGRQRKASDLDIAVSADHPLAVAEKISIINALAELTGRPVDLIDLSVVAEPLLGQIVRHGRRVLGSDTLYGDLIRRTCLSRQTSCPIGQDCWRKGDGMDREVVEQKLESLRRCLHRVETKCPPDAATLAADLDLQDIVSLNLSRAVQISVDIGAHLLPAWRCRPPIPWDKPSICSHRKGC